MNDANVVARIKKHYRVGALPGDGPSKKLKVDPAIRGGTTFDYNYREELLVAGFSAKSGIRELLLRNVSCWYLGEAPKLDRRIW